MSESPDERGSSETWVPWGPPGLKVPGTSADWELVEVSADRRGQGLVVLGYGDARLILDLFGCDCLRVARVDGLRHAASHGAPSPDSGIAAWAVVGSPLGRWVADSSGHRAEETSELAIATRGWLVSLVVDSDCPPRARLSGWDGLPRPTASLAGAPLPPSGAPRGPMGWWEYLDRYGWGEWSPLEAGGRALRSEECYYMEGWRIDARGLAASSYSLTMLCRGPSQTPAPAPPAGRWRPRSGCVTRNGSRLWRGCCRSERTSSALSSLRTVAYYFLLNFGNHIFGYIIDGNSASLIRTRVVDTQILDALELRMN